jgi:hypothetical protein
MTYDYSLLSIPAGTPSVTAEAVSRSDGAYIPNDPENADWRGYQTWLAAGNAPKSVSPLSITELGAYAETTWIRLLAAGRVFNVAASGSTAVNVLCDGTSGTRADLSLLALFGQAYPSGTKTWVDNNKLSTLLTGSQFVALATLVGNWVADTYPALEALLNRIAAKPPTVTTTAEIDAYVWPAS